MKKSFVILSILIITFILTAFGYYNIGETSPIPIKFEKKEKVFLKNDFRKAVMEDIDPDFYLKVGSRFNTVISKNELHHAKSIIDILPKKATQNKANFNSVSIGILEKDNELVKYGNNEQLSSDQLSLLKTAEYSTNFYVISYCNNLLDNGAIENDKISYYMTVVPEKEAEFHKGSKGLLDYLKREIKTKLKDYSKNKLRPGKLTFTIAKDSSIKFIEVNSSSGYTKLDNTFIELISNTKDLWSIAANARGEKVDQEFVLFYGKMGC